MAFPLVFACSHSFIRTRTVQKMACLPTSNTNTSPNVSTKKSAVADSSNTNKASKLIRKRRLTFAPEISKVIGTVISLEDYTVEERQSCWWSAQERSNFRTHSKQLILTLRERGRRCIWLIDDSLQVAQYLSTSLADKEVDSLLKDTSSKYSSKLEAWALNGQVWRGLEKNISVLQKERTSTQREIIAMVLDTQRKGFSSEEAAEFYAEQSLSSRIYARWMGDADCSSVYTSSAYLL
jgi:hypothetical protein